MLVHDFRVAIAVMEDIAAFQHRTGQCGGLHGVHSAEKDGHGEGGHLVVRDLATGVALDQLADLRSIECLAFALAGNQGGDVEFHGMGAVFSRSQAAKASSSISPEARWSMVK